MTRDKNHAKWRLMSTCYEFRENRSWRTIDIIKIESEMNRIQWWEKYFESLKSIGNKRVLISRKAKASHDAKLLHHISPQCSAGKRVKKQDEKEIKGGDAVAREAKIKRTTPLKENCHAANFPIVVNQQNQLFNIYYYAFLLTTNAQ